MMDNNRWLYFIDKKNEVLASMARVGRTPRLEALLSRIDQEVVAALNGRPTVEIKQACQWTSAKGGVDTECLSKYDGHESDPKSNHWKHCPWCGKEIEYAY